MFPSIKDRPTFMSNTPLLNQVIAAAEKILDLHDALEKDQFDSYKEYAECAQHYEELRDNFPGAIDYEETKDFADIIRIVSNLKRCVKYEYFEGLKKEITVAKEAPLGPLKDLDNKISTMEKELVNLRKDRGELLDQVLSSGVTQYRVAQELGRRQSVVARWKSSHQNKPRSS